MAVEERVLSPDDLPGEVEAFVYESADTPPMVDTTLAPRLARRRARAAARIADRKATVEAEIERLRQWQAEQDYSDQREIQRLDVMLTNIFSIERSRDPKRKTMVLPYGVTVKARKVPAQFKRDTKADATRALTEWLLTGGADTVNFIETVCTPRWSELKDCLDITPDGAVYLADTGEVLPPDCGVTFEDAHESVTVKVSTEGDGE